LSDNLRSSVLNDVLLVLAFKYGIVVAGSAALNMLCNDFLVVKKNCP